ncbi:hypothetical protein S58_58120 [Bradyrhizobium oligotrophicum S58]|uniref:Uncharacterized protein n=1 Tax=Bradyrhizobium oligotrophicum S58 TaxID=1245469 RepID=M4ZDF3_9BRAD|nr:hypothetical protein [Bradyrhizobium oligotrophicum]BAM91789.1 hypothetical protein S58_58120 [Bradyrhizobium oligotrophicum S58]
MSISVKGRLAIVALIALACFASSVLKLYLGLLCISLLVSFVAVGVVAWLVERLANKRHRGPERRQGRRRRCSTLIDDSRPLSIPTVDHVDTPSTAGHLQ